MIQIPIVKIIAYSLIPKLVHDIYTAGKKIYKDTYIFSDPPLLKNKPDRTPWTKFSYDVVINKRKTWVTYNKKPIHGRIALKTLIQDINHTLNMHKSQRAIAAVWEGKIIRSELKIGAFSEHTK